ncbi:tyrosine-type recombinase/integrase [Salegentibacter sp. BLCTC]|uniref:tyrosine-type recombinase/integrase n=1 Tax=Salegentibacter sp. BLCTC TaxID=2697368 RepID=UPI00187B3553|nr:tyrosine-type recombinase/integrase [Salegentibacter sp. BLCTC]MBE7641047.1 tyrosine-type recombinase/integrase [Salegentibacter sp. BLCTC]
MATVNFRIRSKANKPVSIFIYVSLEEGNVISTPSGFTVHPKDWSKATKRPKQNSVPNKKTFSKLNRLQEFVYNAVNDAQAAGQLIDVNWLKENIDKCFSRVKKTDQSLLTNHIQYIIDNANTRKIKGSNKIGLSERRVTGYKSFKKTIEDYQKVIKSKIHFQDINKAFIDRFTNWLFNTKNYSTNYAGKILDNLKTVCLDAEKLDIKINDYAHKIEGFKEQNEDRYIQTLSFEELNQISTAKLETPAQDNARKWLLIGCEIGQRASDLLRLTPDDLRYKNNRLYIDIEQKKTGKFITVGVVNTHVKNIVENDFPYKISQQKLNKHIKDVCKLAKIEDEVQGKKYDAKTKRKKLDFYPKYELITSHSFRRSFATNYYKKIPTPVLIGITGHSKESLFLEYINKREDKDLNADLFMQFYETIKDDREPEMKVIKNASNQ